MGIKLPYFLAIIGMLAAVVGGITYFVVIKDDLPAPAPAAVEKRENIMAPRERLPTKGGQQMQLEF